MAWAHSGGYAPGCASAGRHAHRSNVRADAAGHRRLPVSSRLLRACGARGSDAVVHDGRHLSRRTHRSRAHAPLYDRRCSRASRPRPQRRFRVRASKTRRRVRGAVGPAFHASVSRRAAGRAYDPFYGVESIVRTRRRQLYLRRALPRGFVHVFTVGDAAARQERNRVRHAGNGAPGVLVDDRRASKVRGGIRNIRRVGDGGNRALRFSQSDGVVYFSPIQRRKTTSVPIPNSHAIRPSATGPTCASPIPPASSAGACCSSCM
jgi:hypothetical protein